MTELPKKKPHENKNAADKTDDKNESGYYYDDAHGYEVYDPKDDAEDEQADLEISKPPE